MARRRHDKPIEALRTGWTSTADLEETLAGMFQPPSNPPAGVFPAPPAVPDSAALSTPVNSPPASTRAAEDGVQSDAIPRGVSTPVNATPIDNAPVAIGDEDATPVNSGATVAIEALSTPVDTSDQVATSDVLTGVTISHLFLSRTKKRLFRPGHPSEAHTDGEDRLYRFMWDRGREHSPLVRIYAGSISTLARAMGRDDRNTRPLIESLLRKLAIQIARDQDFATKQPRIYYVFHYSEIAARRNQAGLVWALKNKGIQLVLEEEAQRLALEQTPATPVDTDQLVLTPVKTILQA